MFRHFCLLAALLFITGLLYIPGFDGPLIFDDRPNLAPLSLWLNGEVGWQHILFGNNSGPLGRPLSMASFLANFAIAGDSIIALKIGNLLLHLLTGALLYFLLRMLIVRDRHLAPHHSWIPLALTAVWLLHPMMVGTILYIVQRMAILSALFVIATLIAYLHGRKKIEAGSITSGNIFLFVAVPAFTLFATLSKENGLLAPLLCGIVEWVYFIPKHPNRRPPPVRLFTVLFIAVPVVGALVLFLVQPGFFLEGYENRPFGPIERLLTQSRVLFDYVGSHLIPAGPKFSLLRDDYQISTTLFSPLSTLISSASWIFLCIMAVLLRRRVPGFSVGVAIFLVAHSMESTIFPLLIYFEHRNYLPSIGLFLAVASLLAAVGHYLRSKLDHPLRILQVGVSGLLLVLAAGTFARATVWSSSEALVRQALVHYPSSAHLLIELQHIQMTKPNPDVRSARQLSRKLLGHEAPSTQLIGMLNLLRIDCVVEGKTNAAKVDETFNIQPEIVQADLFTAVDILSNVVRHQRCINLSPEQMADGIVRMLEQSNLPKHLQSVWRLRLLAADLYHSAGLLTPSYSHAHAAWIHSERDSLPGLLLLGLQIRLGLREKAYALAEELEASIKFSDHQRRDLLQTYRNELNESLLNSNNSNTSNLPEGLHQHIDDY